MGYFKKNLLTEEKAELLIRSCDDYLIHDCDCDNKRDVEKLSKTITVLKDNSENLSKNHVVDLCLLGLSLRDVVAKNKANGLSFNAMCKKYDNNPDTVHALADIYLSLILDETNMRDRISRIAELANLGRDQLPNQKIDLTTFEDKINYLMDRFRDYDSEVTEYVDSHPEMESILRRKIKTRLSQLMAEGEVMVPVPTCKETARVIRKVIASRKQVECLEQ
jgi:hypothetical protein